VAVYVVEYDSGFDNNGANVAVLPSELKDTLPGTALLFVSFIVNVLVLTVELSTCLLNVAVILSVTGIPVAPGQPAEYYQLIAYAKSPYSSMKASKD
jgi:hypothetical protein